MRFLPALSLPFIFVSCQLMGLHTVNGNGVHSVQQRTVGSFDRIEVTGSMDVELSQGTAPSVRVETDANLQEYIETDIDGSTLRIHSRDGVNLHERSGLKVYVSVANLHAVEVTGSGNITSAGRISSNRFDLSVTGSGNAHLDLDMPEVNVEVTGSGTVSLSGATRRFTSETHGSGSIEAFGLLAEETKVDVSGSGDAQVFASKKLEVEVSGSGDVSYKGTASDVHQEVHGSGSVKKVN